MGTQGLWGEQPSEPLSTRLRRSTFVSSRRQGVGPQLGQGWGSRRTMGGGALGPRSARSCGLQRGDLGWESPRSSSDCEGGPRPTCCSRSQHPPQRGPLARAFSPTGGGLPLGMDQNWPGRIFAISALTLPLCFKVRKVRSKFTSCLNLVCGLDKGLLALSLETLSRKRPDIRSPWFHPGYPPMSHIRLPESRDQSRGTRAARDGCSREPPWGEGRRTNVA